MWWWLLVILLFFLMFAAVPVWPYAGPWRGRRWSYYPSGLLALLLMLLLVLFVFGLF